MPLDTARGWIYRPTCQYTTRRARAEGVANFLNNDPAPYPLRRPAAPMRRSSTRTGTSPTSTSSFLTSGRVRVRGGADARRHARLLEGCARLYRWAAADVGGRTPGCLAHPLQRPPETRLSPSLTSRRHPLGSTIRATSRTLTTRLCVLFFVICAHYCSHEDAAARSSVCRSLGTATSRALRRPRT